MTPGATGLPPRSRAAAKAGAQGAADKPRRSRVAAKAGATGATMVLLLTVVSAQTISSQALAERYIDQIDGISLSDAIARALEQEPSLRAARAQLEAARGMRQQTTLRSNPSLTFERREEPTGTDNQTTLQVSVPLELFRRSARIAVADRELEIAERSVVDRIRVLVNDVKMRYGRAAAAAREVAILDNLALAARRDLDLLRRQVDEGGSPPLDRDRSAVEVQRIEAARLQAVARTEAAAVELKRSLGASPDTPLKLKQPLEVLAPVAPSGETRDAADRADVREAEEQVRLAEARITQAGADGRFDVTVFASYMRMDAGFPQRALGAGGNLEPVHGLFHYASAGATVLLPLWNRNQGAVAAARAERAAAAAHLDAAQLSAQAEVAAASTRAAQTLQALGLVSDGVVLARKNLDVVRQTFDLGRATLQDVLTEQRRYLDVEREYTSALQEAFEARISLEFARGEMK